MTYMGRVPHCAHFNEHSTESSFDWAINPARFPARTAIAQRKRKDGSLFKIRTLFCGQNERSPFRCDPTTTLQHTRTSRQGRYLHARKIYRQHIIGMYLNKHPLVSSVPNRTPHHLDYAMNTTSKIVSSTARLLSRGRCLCPCGRS